MKRGSFLFSFKTRVTLVLILAMVFVTGLSNFFIYRFDLAENFRQLRNSLTVIAQTATLAVDAETLQKIPLTWEGVHSPAYREVAAKLGKVLGLSEPLQYVYILSKTKTPGTLRFLIDIESPSRPVHRKRSAARPGDLYDANEFPEMLEAFSGPSADRNLQTDPWGVTLSGYAPVVRQNGEVIAVLGVDMMADEVAFMQRELKKRMIFVFFSGILFCCVLGILIAGSVSGPVRKLVEGTRQLAGENLDYRVQVRSRDEIGELADSFNKMAESLSDSRRRLRDYFFKVTQSLVRALEAKDPYTQGHSERVADLARKVALELGMNADQADLIRCVAELHDIGKLVIHENILNKKEKLDPLEWKTLQEHPSTGAKILEPVLDEELLRVIRSHHERVDGKGYPEGLKGDAINLPSQIVSIADAYDAMTSVRSYRKPLDREAALNEIKRARGTQFRSDVVSAFLRVISQLP
jgi:putative nucleotidyltransferase with HDIG domain